MTQQTAVYYLVNELRLNLTIYKHTKNVIEQAKSMEKEQIQKAFSDGQELPINNPLLPHYSSEEYYNNTYTQCSE